MNVKIPPIFCSLKKLECSLESLKYKKKIGFFLFCFFAVIVFFVFFVVVVFPTACAPFRIFMLLVVMACVICVTLRLQSSLAVRYPCLTHRGSLTSDT